MTDDTSDTVQRVSDFLRASGDVHGVTVDGAAVALDRGHRYWAARAGETIAAMGGSRVLALGEDGAVLGALRIEDADDADDADAVTPVTAAYRQAYRDMQRMSAAASAAGQLLLGEAMAALRQAQELRADAAREQRRVASQLATVQAAVADQRAQRRAQRALSDGSDSDSGSGSGSDSDVEALVARALSAQLPGALMEVARALGIPLPALS